jgi:cytochrome P450
MAVGKAAAPFDLELAHLFDGPEAIQDPFPLYERLRREAPVCLWRDTVAVLSKHRLIKEAYRDTARFPALEVRSQPRFGGEGRLSPEDRHLIEDVYTFERNTISRMNGERHVRVRGAAHRYFTPGRIEQLRSRMQQVLDDLLAPLSRTETVDLMPVAYRLPLLMITDLLGVPREDAEQVKAWGDAINHHEVSNPDRPEALRAAHRAITEQSAYCRELVERQRREPAASELVAGVLDAAAGDRLLEEELVAFYVHTLFAGHETTQHMVGNGVRAFMLHRDQWERLCQDPSLTGSAVEEVLRWDPPVHVNVKTTSAELEVDGVAIPQGARVVMLLASANRDPEVFDNSTSFDITRDPNDHLALAFGPHFCLGASLARLEGQVVFSTLVARYPKMELGVAAGDLSFHRGLRGLDELPVRLGPPGG